MMHKYEALLLTIPEITGDEAKDLEMQLDKVIKTGSGSIVSFERWGKYKLAYDVNKNEYGVYFLMRFEGPKKTTLIKDMKTYISVKLGNIVKRDMISWLDPKSPLTYQRPRSLEEAPAREEGFSRGDAKQHGASYFAASDRNELGDE